MHYSNSHLLEYLEKYAYKSCDFEYEENIELIHLLKYISVKCSDQIALKFGEKEYSYKQLDVITDELASALTSTLGRKHVVVGICLDKSDRFIISLIAILKCGSTFLPLSKIYPYMRIKRMLELGGCTTVITDSTQNVAKLPGVTQVDYDELFDNYINYNGEYDLSYRERAYIIFTSGSTGEPKGIAIRKYSLVNLAYAMEEELLKNSQNHPCQTVGVMSDFAFDASIGQIFMAFLTGRTLQIIPDEIKVQPELLIEFFKDSNLDLCEFTPLHLNTLIEHSGDITESSWLPTFIINCGEALPLNLAVKIMKMKEERIIFNYYGPTETTVYCTVFTISKATIKNLNKMVIGRPIKNTNIHILDKNMKLLSNGKIGEIYVSGNGLAEGYVNNPELTQAVFIENRPETARRMYKTGDIGRWTETGEIEYLGREDNQVKIRGYRIEIGEIEKVINKLTHIKSCRVIDKRDKSEVHLVAYYSSDTDLTLEDLLAEIKTYLPDYMIPSYFVPVKEFPINTNGKLDKVKLPDYKTFFLRSTQKSDISHGNLENEGEILNICRDILNVPQLSLEDNFFLSGGNSLLIYLLINRVYEKFGIKLNINTVYESNNIWEIAQTVKKLVDQSKTIKETANKLVIKKAPVTSFMNILLNLERSIWYKRKNMSGKVTGTSINNVVNIVTVNKFLNYDIFAKAVETTVLHQEGLRVSFQSEKGHYTAFLNNCKTVNVEFIRCKDVEDLEHIRVYVKEFSEKDTQLFQIALCQDSANNQKILLNMFHPLFDFMSMQVLLSNLLMAYDGIKLNDIETNYLQYLNKLSMADKEKGIAFWREYYKDRPTAALYKEKYLLHPDPDVKIDDAYTNKEFYIKSGLLTKLRLFCNKTGISEYEFLFFCFAILLARDSKSKDIILGTYVPGRTIQNHTQMELVGCFMNLIGVRVKISKNKKIIEQIKEQKKRLINSIPYQYLNFFDFCSLIGKDGYIKGELFKVIYNYVDKQRESLRFGNYIIKVEEIGQEPELPYPLAFKAFSYHQDVRINVKYIERIYSDKVIEHLWFDYISLMENIIKRPDIEIDELY